MDGNNVLTQDHYPESLATEFQNVRERLKKNDKPEVPKCNCILSNKVSKEPVAYYTHLGAAASLADLRQDLERRTGLRRNAIRFEKIVHTTKEGKTRQGCPLAKWIIRRVSIDEKILVVVKHRSGHRCSASWIVVNLVVWEGVPHNEANALYSMLAYKLNKFGLPTLRKCETNKSNTCTCQGLDNTTCGASYSFGCSWSMWHNGCKYAKSKPARKFKLSVESEEPEMEDRMNALASLISPMCRNLTPQAYENMTFFETEASECRLGNKKGRLFSGVTACVDFSTHSTFDRHSINNGITCVVTLAKHRSLEKPVNEQLYVLPFYTLDDTDEFDNRENQLRKSKNGSIDVLTKFESELRIRSGSSPPCTRKATRKKEVEKAIQPLQSQEGAVTGTIDNEECFKDSEMGGVAIALGHGSVLFKCAQHERYCTTALRKPNRRDPTCITLILYQHKNLNSPKHGCFKFEEGTRQKGLQKQNDTTTKNHCTSVIITRLAESLLPVHDQQNPLQIQQQTPNSPQTPQQPLSQLQKQKLKSPELIQQQQSRYENQQLQQQHKDYMQNQQMQYPMQQQEQHMQQEKNKSRQVNDRDRINIDTTNSMRYGYENHEQMQEQQQHQHQQQQHIIKHDTEIYQLIQRQHLQQWQQQQKKQWSQNVSNKPRSNFIVQDHLPQNLASEFQKTRENMKNNVKPEIPRCDCFRKVQREPVAYYTSLGVAASLSSLRQELENRVGLRGNAIRFEKISYTEKEGKTMQGCPLSKWIIRRASLDEKILAVVKQRPGHRCSTAWIVVVLVSWEAIPQDYASDFYTMLVYKLNKFGIPTLRNCGTNKSKTCACQGLNETTCGSSYSFGCSWSMYFNGCKYGRNKTKARKFKFSVESEEQEMEDRMNALASLVAPVCRKLAPQGYENMTFYETEGSECRLGNGKGRPFSGVTACIDYCTHTHRDIHDVVNGITCVVTLTKDRNREKLIDEQLHVLPFYSLDSTDEFDNRENQLKKTKEGSIEVLTKFECEVRVKSVTLQSCPRMGRKRKKSAEGIQPSPLQIGEVRAIVNNEECFEDSKMGGVAIALEHGSVLLECAQSERTSTTALRRPNRQYPTSISVIFYQHKNLNRPKHGNVEWEAKARLKRISILRSLATTKSLWTSIPSNQPPNETITSNTAEYIPSVFGSHSNGGVCKEGISHPNQGSSTSQLNPSSVPVTPQLSNHDHAIRQQTPSSGTVTRQPTAHLAGDSTNLTVNGNDPSPNPNNMVMTTDLPPGSEMPLDPPNVVPPSIADFASIEGGQSHLHTVWQSATIPSDTGPLTAWLLKGHFVQPEDIQYQAMYPPPASAVKVEMGKQPFSDYQSILVEANDPSYAPLQPVTVLPSVHDEASPMLNSVVLDNGMNCVKALLLEPAEFITENTDPEQESSLAR